MIQSPEELFGFKIGTDKKLARWNEIVDYFWHIDKNSPHVKVIELGKSTMGHPFLLSIISSSENLEKIKRYRSAARCTVHSILKGNKQST